MAKEYRFNIFKGRNGAGETTADFGDASFTLVSLHPLDTILGGEEILHTRPGADTGFSAIPSEPNQKIYQYDVDDLSAKILLAVFSKEV